MVRVPKAKSDCCWARRSQATYTRFWNHMVRVPDAKSDCFHRGEAEVRILNSKTTWLEFQKPSQTATERDKVKLRILDFKTTLSEFQKPCQTTNMIGKAKVQSLFTSLKSVASICSTPRIYPRSKYFLVLPKLIVQLHPLHHPKDAAPDATCMRRHLCLLPQWPYDWQAFYRTRKFWDFTLSISISHPF